MSFWSKPEELEPPESAPIDRNPFAGSFAPDWAGTAKRHTHATHRDTLSFEAELALERAQIEEAQAAATRRVVAAKPAPAAPPPAKERPSQYVTARSRAAMELESTRRALATDRQTRMLKLLTDNRGRGTTSGEFERELDIPATTVQGVITALRGLGHVIIGRRRWGYGLADAGVAAAAPAAPARSDGPSAAAVRVRPSPPAPVMTLLEATALRDRSLRRQPVDPDELKLALSIIAVAREGAKRGMEAA